MKHISIDQLLQTLIDLCNERLTLLQLAQCDCVDAAKCYASSPWLTWLQLSWTPFKVWINLLWYAINLTLLNSLQSTKFIFSWRCPVILLKNSQTLLYKLPISPQNTWFTQISNIQTQIITEKALNFFSQTSHETLMRYKKKFPTKSAQPIQAPQILQGIASFK